MCWPASARHPGQSSPSTMSYSFPVPLPAPPPPLPPLAARPRRAVLARQRPLGLHGPARPGPPLGPGQRRGPQLSRREAFSSPAGGDRGLTRGRMVHRELAGEPARSHPGLASAPPGKARRGALGPRGVRGSAGTTVSQGKRAPAPPCSHQLLFSSPRICFRFLHIYTLKMMFALPHPFLLHHHHPSLPPGR